MTDAQVSQVAVEVIRTNLAVSAQVTQLAVEVLRPNAPKGISGGLGTFTLTGNAAALVPKSRLASAVGSFTLTGQAASLPRIRNIAAFAGTIVLTGQNAALKLPGKMLAAPGAFTLAGNAALMKRAVTMSVAQGAFTLIGYAAEFHQWARNLTGGVGSFSLTGKQAVPSGSFNIIDPVSGLTVLENVRAYVSPYASADDAYNSWAATLGVSSTGTDYAVSTSAVASDFVTLLAPILDGSTYSAVNIPHSGAVAMYMLPPTVTAVTSALYTDGSATTLGYLPLSTDRPMFAFRVFNSQALSFQQQNTNLKLRSGYNPTTGAYETIIITTAANQSTSAYPIRCAYRMARGLFECVLTVTDVDIPPSGYVAVGYITANESTGIPVIGRYLATMVAGGTLAITSDDLSAFRPIVTETVGTADSLTKVMRFPVVSAEAMTLRDVLKTTWALTVTSPVVATDDLTKAFRLGPTIAELFTIAETHAPSWKFSALLTDRTILADALVTAFPAVIADTVELTDLIQVFRGVIVAEQLRLIDAPQGAGTFAAQLVDVLRVTDDLRRFLGGAVADTVSIAESLTRAPVLGKMLTDTVGVADTLTQKLIIRVTANDDFNLDDTTPAKWIFSPVLTDGVEIAVGYIEPNGSFTTWAVNTRTGAVTEYQNFVFNSFAQTGHKYLGASDAGLYELDGADDDGTDVIAHIKSGYAQFGGSKYSSFKAAYLGMRGDGDIILKLDTGDGKSYTYQTVIQDMQSTKVRLGKGLRARYFSFELISTGPDFDLDTIEFIPLVAQRRV